MPIQILNEIEEEITHFLSNLIRINTTNPPGNETQAANFIAQYSSQRRLQIRNLRVSTRKRQRNNTAKGNRRKTQPALALTPRRCCCKPSEWSVDPFAGTVKDGYVYGRGAYDMKGMTAVELFTLELLKKNNIPLKGDVCLGSNC